MVQGEPRLEGKGHSKVEREQESAFFKHTTEVISMTNVVNMKTTYFQATIRCSHCRHTWSGIFLHEDCEFQCPECLSMDGKIIADIVKVKG